MKKSILLSVVSCQLLVAPARAAVMCVVDSGMSYSTAEQDTGKKWIDGKTIYQKTITGTFPVVNQWTDLASVPGLSKIINFTAINDANEIVAGIMFLTGGGGMVKYSFSNMNAATADVRFVVIDYTK